MKKNYTLFLSVISFAALLSSCKKEDTSPSPEGSEIQSIMDKYNRFLSANTNGIILVQSNVANNDSALKNIIVTSAVFYDKDGNVDTSKAAVEVGPHLLPLSAPGNYGFDKSLPQQGLFGANVTYKVKRSQVGAEPNGAAITLYSPQPILITNIAPMISVKVIKDDALNLTWNKDADNKNGVMILAEYSPTRYINKPALSAGYIKYIENSKLVIDNGNISLPWSFFSVFPPGGHITVWVSRDSYAILPDGKYAYKIRSRTASAIWDAIMP